MSDKRLIVMKMFVSTADDNYILARWCYLERLNVDFFWLSLHALEKYMKAALLLNEKSSRGYSHNICKLYQDTCQLAGDLIQPLKRPHWWTGVWREGPNEAFVERINYWGDPHNRYNVLGHAREAEELFKLDQLVFILRRLCQVLDAYAVPKNIPVSMRPTFRDQLARDLKKWELSSSGNLEKTIAGKRGEGLKHAALRVNEQFTAEDYEDDPVFRSGFSMSTSVLSDTLLRPLEGSQSASVRARAARVTTWALQNIHLPDAIVDQLRAALPPQD